MKVYTGNGSSFDCVIVAHGSTETAYNEDHPLINFLLGYTKTVYSLDLPGHGSLQLREASPLTFNEAFEQLVTLLLPYVTQKRVLFVGFSLGGLFGIKLSTSLERFTNTWAGIYIGAALRISTHSEEHILQFFEESSYEEMGWANQIQKHHGPHWRELLATLRSWLQVNSFLRPTSHELHRIREGKHYFILAERDQAFSREDILYAETPEAPIPLYIVKGHHFTYFHPKVGWPQTRQSLIEIINHLSSEQ